MVDNNGLYALKLVGEKHVYELRGSEQHSFATVCDMVSDLTGYRADYLAREPLNHMNIGQEIRVVPAGIGTFGDSPALLVKRVG